MQEASEVIDLDSPRDQTQSRLGLNALLPPLITLVTLIAFLPGLENGFVAWDDDKLLVENVSYRGLGWDQLRWMFTTLYMGHYQPLTWLSFSLDYLLWGSEPFGYHLTNLIIHAANAVFFYFVGRRLLTLALPGNDAPSWKLHLSAALAALLFAIHPLRVESVVWATERRDLVSTFFFFWTLYCYLRACSSLQPRSHQRWLWAAVGIYCLSLLSKATAMTLPVVLLLLDIYPLRRIEGRPGDWLTKNFRGILWEKWPFVLLAVAFAALALLAQHTTGALTTVQGYTLSIFRVGQAFYGLVFYLWKTLLPMGLSPLYELPFDPTPWALTFALCGVAAVVITVAFYLLRERWPAVFASWIYYIIILAPVLGIAQSGPQLVADRYSYLSCLSWALLAAGAIFFYRVPAKARRISGLIHFVVAVAVVGTVFMLSSLTWAQTKLWRDSRTLWEYVLSVTPNASLGHYHMGIIFEDQGKVDEALRSYRRSVILNPGRPDVRYNFARLLARKGQQDEAIVNYRLVLQVDPKNALAHYSLGSLLGMRGDIGEARQYLEQAINLKPDYAEAHSNLGNVLSMQGQPKEAVQHYQKSLEADPNSDDTRFNLGMALLHLSDFDAAAEQFRLVLKKRPDFAEAHFLLANSLAARGLISEAIAEFRDTVRLKPDFADGHVALARALAMTEHKDEAAQHYQQALALLKSQRQSAKKDK
jgi:protein O-mannosyl-transferase